ncbi:YraN family protein [Cylindrospermopsis raciborskii]|uniref:YraN family protein n=2 Tax=Cylindrospermopsis raciborskii TaxID=77022 RepID=UPI00215B4CA4|nr:YraN family protein [Cylindrospermopsis raciborskii]
MQAEQKRLSQEHQQEYEQRQRKHEEEMDQFRIFMEETRKMVAETNKNMGSITSRWGEFVENLVRPAAARLFKEQGINVHYTSLQVKAHDYKGSIEIDIWAENDGEIVAIEVKSHLPLVSQTRH